MSPHRTRIVGAALAAALAMPVVDATAGGLAAQSSQHQGVTVRVTPVDVAAASKAWTFEVALDTHSQELGDDLARSATLVDASGRPQAPLGWDGAPAGGHHRKGVLRFAPIDPPPAVLELRLQRPGEAAPRTFRWAMK